jgi:hypothetical protein
MSLRREKEKLVLQEELSSRRVEALRFVGREDCYDFTVKVHHNFAVADSSGGGIFVHNSAEDVCFARTVLRVQRELRNGFRKIGRVHLSALNIDPQRVDYDINMTVPSAVFELAQMEVRNSRADLANRMKEFVSLHWIMSNVFGMSDGEIETVSGQRSEDAVREQVDMAQGQAASAAVMSGIPAGAEGVEDDNAAPAAESSATIAKALRARQILLSPGKVVGKPISERELFAGSRESEKRAHEKLDKLLKTDTRLAIRIEELRGLMTDLRGSVVRKS